MKQQLKELVVNDDGKLSTTATIQFAGFVGLLIVMLASVYLNRPYVPTLFGYFAAYCGGLRVSKGVVDAYREGKS